MSKIAIVYFSGMGHTHLMAEAVAAGAKKVEGSTVELLRITGEQITDGRWQDDATIEKLNRSNAIIFGSPTTIASPPKDMVKGLQSSLKDGKNNLGIINSS
jgi:NAD(P)H dehydrogenase (quinone)